MASKKPQAPMPDTAAASAGAKPQTTPVAPEKAQAAASATQAKDNKAAGAKPTVNPSQATGPPAAKDKNSSSTASASAAAAAAASTADKGKSGSTAASQKAGTPA